MRRWTIINVLLAGLVALLGLEIVRTWARSLPPVDVVARPPSAGGPEPERREKDRGRRGDKKEARAAETPAVLVATIADKDLFDPSRQKPSEDAIAKGQQAMKPETNPPAGVTVVGIRIQGGDREAFISETTQNNKHRRVRPGDQIAGYTVKGIETARLLLSSPSGDPVTMELAVDRKGKPPRPPTAQKQPHTAGMAPAAGMQAASPAAGIAPPPTVAGVPPPPPPAPPAASQPQQAAVPPATVPTSTYDALREQRERARLGGKR